MEWTNAEASPHIIWKKIAEFVQNRVRVLGTVPHNPVNFGITPTTTTSGIVSKYPARLAAGILRETAFVLDFEVWEFHPRLHGSGILFSQKQKGSFAAKDHSRVSTATMTCNYAGYLVTANPA